MLPFALLLSFLWIRTQGSPFSPNGTAAYETWSYGTYLFPNQDVSLGLSIFAPTTPGKYPVWFFLTGFEGFAPGFIYSQLLNQLASKGEMIIVAGSKDKFMGPKQGSIVVGEVLDWIASPTGLTHNLVNHSLTQTIPDIENGVFLGSHSSAGHGVVQYLNKTCGIVKGVVLIDPVDGLDPWGIIHDYIITPGKKVPFETPVLHLECGLDPKSNNPGEPACAPANMSNARFANAMAAQVWQLNATAYGHADILNPPFIQLAKILCVSGVPPNDPHLYYDETVGAIYSFFRMVYYQDWTYEKYLTVPSLAPVNVIEKHWVVGTNTDRPKPFCKHQ